MEIPLEAEGTTLDVRTQPDEWLVSSLRELAAVAVERGLLTPGSIDIANTLDNNNRTLGIAGEALTKESLREQLIFTHTGYRETVKAFASYRPDRHDNRFYMEDYGTLTGPEIEQAFDAWFSQEKIDSARAINPDANFVLVAAPSIEPPLNAIAHATKEFALKLGVYAKICDRAFGTPLTRNPRLPAYNTPKYIHFSIIPTKYTPGTYGSVSVQEEMLHDLQAKHPAVRAATLVDALTYYYTLYELGAFVSDSNLMELTEVRAMLDIDPKNTNSNMAAGLFIDTEDSLIELYTANPAGIQMGRFVVG